MLRALHVVYVKIFLWNPTGHSIFRDCFYNQFRAEKLVEQQIIECMASLECMLFTILIVPELAYNHVSDPNFATKET